MVIPTLLAPSNSAAGVRLVRSLGFDGSEERERRANEAGDPTGYEFAHLVFGVRGAVPRAISSSGLRCVREDAAVTWVSGTFAAWWRAIITEDLAASWRAGAASLLTATTGFCPFGNPRFLAETPKWLFSAQTPVAGTPAADAWGGLVSVALDRQAEEDFVKAGARVLRRTTVGAPTPPWAMTGKADDELAEGEAGRRGRGKGGLALAGAPAAVTVIGSLALPLVAEELDPGERKLLERFETEYRKAMTGLKSPAALAALRLPFELTTMLLAIDGAAIKQCLAASHATTARVARALEHLHHASCAAAPADVAPATATPAKTRKGGTALEPAPVPAAAD